MKRLISLLLVVFMLAALLISCGDDTSTPSKKPSGGGGGGDDDPDDPIIETNWWDDVNFGNKTIKLQLSKVEDVELACGCVKYMQGPDQQLDENGSNSNGTEKVQNEVRERNLKAVEDLGLKPEYSYITANWGSARGEIQAKEAAGTGNTPDMYCDMMYDMSALTINNTFANILKYTKTNDAMVSGWIGGYFDISKVNGYYVDLMEDMALTEDRQFLIAGDYYMDVLRAMVVMPFNMAMYTEYATNDPDCAQLYKSVEDGTWTWDALMGFSNVYTDDGDASVTSDNLLMALSNGGLSAVGLIYSTAFQNYTMDDSGLKVKYTLNNTCPELQRLFANASTLVNTPGVVCNADTSGDVTGVNKCKEIFTNGRALFAGPSMLGVVEEKEFGEMQQISVLPVPKLGVNYDYNTPINSRARVGAVSFHSTNKVEISAWIQYCTEQSETVRDRYFDTAMSGKYLIGSGAGKILTMIYDNIGDNKSMILDNMIMAKDWDVGLSHSWSQLIREDYFTGHANDIKSQYDASIKVKQSVLNDIVDAWYQTDATSAN